MEKRLGKINISAAGGTAGKGAKTYKLTVPSAWIAELGITADEREVELRFDGERIIISRPMVPARLPKFEPFIPSLRNSERTLFRSIIRP